MTPRDTTAVLLKIMEECAETIQICSKCIFYGVDNVSPKVSNLDKQSNGELLVEELGDIMANVKLLVENTNSGITYEAINTRKDEKYPKLESYIPEAK